MATTYIERGSESSPTSEQVFSFSAWVKLDFKDSSRDMIFCQTRDGVITDFLSFFFHQTTRQLHLYGKSGNTTFVDLVSKKYKDKWGLFGTLCIQKDYTEILKGKNYEILKEGTDV